METLIQRTRCPICSESVLPTPDAKAKHLREHTATGMASLRRAIREGQVEPARLHLELLERVLDRMREW